MTSLTAICLALLVSITLAILTNCATGQDAVAIVLIFRVLTDVSVILNSHIINFCYTVVFFEHRAENASDLAISSH